MLHIHALVLVVENDELKHMLGFRILSKLIHDYTPWGVEFYFFHLGVYFILLVSYMGFVLTI
jgi:hypothetical protein